MGDFWSGRNWPGGRTLKEKLRNATPPTVLARLLLNWGGMFLRYSFFQIGEGFLIGPKLAQQANFEFCLFLLVSQLWSDCFEMWVKCSFEWLSSKNVRDFWSGHNWPGGPAAKEKWRNGLSSHGFSPIALKLGWNVHLLYLLRSRSVICDRTKIGSVGQLYKKTFKCLLV